MGVEPAIRSVLFTVFYIEIVMTNLSISPWEEHAEREQAEGYAAGHPVEGQR